MIDNTREFILCAAIHVNDGIEYNEQPGNIVEGFVIAGRRHSDCYTVIEAMCKKLNRDDLYASISNQAPRQHQGFITSKNRFVSRNQALKIAVLQQQIVHGPKTYGQDDILISENLY